MFEFLIQNNLITPNQSGFKTGDSCINQLISITHEIYKLFDHGYEVRGVFFDTSKAFEKVWLKLKPATPIFHQCVKKFHLIKYF